MLEVETIEEGVSAPFEKRKRAAFRNPETVPKEQIVEEKAHQGLCVFRPYFYIQLFCSKLVEASSHRELCVMSLFVYSIFLFKTCRSERPSPTGCVPSLFLHSTLLFKIFESIRKLEILVI